MSDTKPHSGTPAELGLSDVFHTTLAGSMSTAEVGCFGTFGVVAFLSFSSRVGGRAEGEGGDGTTDFSGVDWTGVGVGISVFAFLTCALTIASNDLVFFDEVDAGEGASRRRSANEAAGMRERSVGIVTTVGAARAPRGTATQAVGPNRVDHIDRPAVRRDTRLNLVGLLIS